VQGLAGSKPLYLSAKRRRLLTASPSDEFNVETFPRGGCLSLSPITAENVSLCSMRGSSAHRLIVGVISVGVFAGEPVVKYRLRITMTEPV